MDKIKIIKNRSDLGAGTRGSDMGVDAIEIAAINSDNDYFNRYDFEDLKTENDAVYDKQNNPFAKRISKVLTICERLSTSVRDTLMDNSFPLVLSGDHSSALGSISGVKTAFPDKKLGVIWIDAHADVHSPHTSPSGNIHGMPLSAALDADNLDKQINTVSGMTKRTWENLKNIGGIRPKIYSDNVVYFGVRDTEEPEDYIMEKMGLRNYKVDEVRFRGLELCVNEALDRLKDCDVIYISFDVDSMDCDLISKGTGTPVSKGFDQYEVMAIINQIVRTGKVACFEVVEINPTLDNKGNKMAEVAFEVLDNVTKTISETKRKAELELYNYRFDS